MSHTLTKPFTTGRRLVAAVAILALSACGGGDPEPAAPTENEKATQILTSNGGTWTPPPTAGVIIDGVDVTEELFPGFSITFQEKTFTTKGTTPVWLRQDTWSFKDASGKVIIRGQDEKEITITEISDSHLKLTLEWSETTHGPGRQGSLKGKHEFILNR